MLNSTSILELDTLPEHLLIIGGGYVGLEFGQMFRRFGSQVTLIQRQPRLLMREDEDVSDVIAEIFREEGITVLTNTTPQPVEQRDGCIRLTVSAPQGEQQLSGSHLLSAVGRIPNTEALTLAPRSERGQYIGRFAPVAGQQLRRLPARARKEAEDMLAEAQQVRQSTSEKSDQA